MWSSSLLVTWPNHFVLASLIFPLISVTFILPLTCLF
jgi:hypothetical protein